jgi:hypothetical protein
VAAGDEAFAASEGGVMAFDRSIEFTAAYDMREKGYGIHGAECWFILKKDGKALTWSLFTNWMLPHVQAETDARPPSLEMPYLAHKPMSATVASHYPYPTREDQTPNENCEHLGGCKCYGDCSFTVGERFFTALVERGSDGAFEEMEKLWPQWMEEEPYYRVSA